MNPPVRLKFAALPTEPTMLMFGTDEDRTFAASTEMVPPTPSAAMLPNARPVVLKIARGATTVAVALAFRNLTTPARLRLTPLGKLALARAK